MEEKFMKRIVNWQKKRVEYVINEQELRHKLGIPESFQGGVYWSTGNRTLKIFCVMPESEK